MATTKRQAETREGMVTMTVAMPAELHRALAIAALDDHASMNELIRDAVRDFLDRRKRRRR